LAALPGAWAADAGDPEQLRVELPAEVRMLAGQGGRPSKVKQALVSVAWPPGFEAGRDWPVLVVNATSDPGYNSSRGLAAAYRSAATAAGWVVVAADPEPGVTQDDDQLTLRYALDVAALAALQGRWRGAEKPLLAFAGFSGGAKYTGWMAALFHSQGARVAGAYMAGVNQDALGDAARKFGLAKDASFRSLPVFLQGGTDDNVATPAQHRRVQAELRDAGFQHVRLEFVPGGHAVDASLMKGALEWFAAAGSR
jgi:predicted esterase